MRTRIVRIGNSQGIRIPKPLLEQARLTEDVELHVGEGCITIASPARTRAGWAAAAAALHERDEDVLLDELTPTRFDREEWKWR